MHAGIPPALGPGTPQEQTPPGTRHPPPPGADTPPGPGIPPGSRQPPPGADAPPDQAPPPREDGCRCGRYASYWNAFLLNDTFAKVYSVVPLLITTEYQHYSHNSFFFGLWDLSSCYQNVQLKNFNWFFFRSIMFSGHSVFYIYN